MKYFQGDYGRAKWSVAGICDSFLLPVSATHPPEPVPSQYTHCVFHFLPM